MVEKYKRSNSGVSSLDKRVLYDFRNPTAASPPDIAAGVQQLAFSVVPPASCPVDPKQPPPKLHITSVASGSFTYAAEQEKAYLVAGLPCGWQNKIVVVAGGKVQASSDTAYALIAGIYDLNRDDKNELLLVGETTHQGEVSREASLQTFEKNSLRPVEQFGIVNHDSCALFAGANEATKNKLIGSGLTPYVEAVVISYLPHPGREMPSFTAERYKAPCPAAGGTPKDWQPVSPKSS